MYQVPVRTRHQPGYEIIIENRADFSRLVPFVRDCEVLIVTNQTVEPLFLPELTRSIADVVETLHVCTLPDGEHYKTQKSLSQIYQRLLTHRYSRNCILIALGGGVIGDMTGFAAATYLRGVSVIQVPTTLLSQVDASVGGKTAVNHPLGKNMIGAFFQPSLVYTATAFLASLPQREFCAGLAEVIKYGCIFDEAFFSRIEENVAAIRARVPKVTAQLIARSCEIKAEIVAADEHEQKGLRALLNFGHTFAHGIECCQHYVGLKHGEAVGVGMVLAFKLSVALGYIDSADVERITRLLKALNIPTELPQDVTPKALIEAMLRDKKNTRKDEITFILLDKIGQAKLDHSVNLNQLKQFLEPPLTA